MSTMAMLTREDLDALPDDGLRHELIDGVFIMNPAPGFHHQNMVLALATALRAAAGAHVTVLAAPFDVVLGPNVVEPDIVAAPRAAFTDRDLPTAPLLAVEVHSPTTGRLDESLKRSLYEEYGVASYWLVDPLTPAVTVLELIDGRYTEVVTATGDQTIEVRKPFPISLNPADLARS